VIGRLDSVEHRASAASIHPHDDRELIIARVGRIQERMLPFPSRAPRSFQGNPSADGVVRWGPRWRRAWHGSGHDPTTPIRSHLKAPTLESRRRAGRPRALAALRTGSGGVRGPRGSPASEARGVATPVGCRVLAFREIGVRSTAAGQASLELRFPSGLGEAFEGASKIHGGGGDKDSDGGRE
jgi:hypothetical protein